jgi:hypothetical protein
VRISALAPWTFTPFCVEKTQVSDLRPRSSPGETCMLQRTSKVSQRRLKRHGLSCVWGGYAAEPWKGA